MNPVQFSKPSVDLSVEPTAARVTPRQGPSFREVLGTSASSLVRGAESALHRLPGGPVLAAAVRSGAGGSVRSGSIASPASPAVASNPEGPSAESTASSGAPSLEGALSASQDMNLYFLQLQEAMSAENRAYTAQSNVLKARHDTVKNAIGNIR